MKQKKLLVASTLTLGIIFLLAGLVSANVPAPPVLMILFSTTWKRPIAAYVTMTRPLPALPPMLTATIYSTAPLFNRERARSTAMHVFPMWTAIRQFVPDLRQSRVVLTLIATRMAWVKPVVKSVSVKQLPPILMQTTTAQMTPSTHA